MEMTPIRVRWNNKSYRSPKDTCIYDGRLIHLKEKDITDLNDRICKKPFAIGSFGKLYKTTGVFEGFDLQIAIKKIEFDEEDTHKNRSIRREMIASRILHPFILPLLAVVDRPFGISEVWIVSPFFKNGDLQQAIANKSNPLKEKDRVKILLQLATAIQYIHTKMPNVRDVILHKDISSKKVVLSAENNARLIDFGLAREKDDQTSDPSERMFYRHPYLGKGKPETECWDYYMFGIIVKEMLTGLGPDGINSKYLKDMTRDEISNYIKEKNTTIPLSPDIQKVWSSKRTVPDLNNIASDLNDFSDRIDSNDLSLKCDGWRVDEFKMKVVEKIKSLWVRYLDGTIYDVENKKCHICMINPKAKKTSMTQMHAANCQQKIRVCISCEKNSFLNPITCNCGTKLTPLGRRWGALLVAGNDGNKEKAKILTRDVTELKKLLTSKAPCIVGISENNIRMVTPCSQNNPNSKEEELLPQIRENVKYFKEQTELDTLLIYFSGHSALDKGSGNVESSSFVLRSDSEIVTLADFEKMLNDLDKVDKLIIILDRCHPPKISFQNKNRKVIQINACNEKEKTNLGKTGSIFTQTLIEGLNGKAQRLSCPNDCQFCKDYFDGSSNFITVSSIFEYLGDHIDYPKPRMVQDSDSDSSNIAYFTDEQVQIEFTDKEKNEQQVVKLEYLQNMEQLRSELFKEFGTEKTSVKVQRDTFREDKQFEDCDTIEKVMQAWVNRQPLIVQFESIKQTDTSN